jgi:catechol 2,3-dioxygenase-like lactoylglutathione lyase family enzyme
MAIELNHTIVWCRDKRKSAKFLADVLGLPAPTALGPFLVVAAGNGVSLDFHDTDGEIASQHYAFLVSEDEFDEIFGRLRERQLQYWADPGQHQSFRINHNDGGRGVYFEDPDSHLLEIINTALWQRRPTCESVMTSSAKAEQSALQHCRFALFPID